MYNYNLVFDDNSTMPETALRHDFTQECTGCT